MAPDSIFRTLIMDLISGKISGSDRTWFDDMILDEEREVEFSEVLVERFEYQKRINQDSVMGDAGPDESAWEGMVQAIVSGSAVERDPFILNAEKAVLLSERTISDTLLKKMPIHKISWAVPVAASVIVLLGLTVYFGFFYKVKTEKAVEKNITLVQDVAPGGNRATLTLGNGATMILDSEAVGTLAQQGNTKISKTDSGQISYSIEKNKPTTIEENVLSTPRGGQYQLELPDGTKVWLNAAFSITYPTAFEGKQRFVKVAGEVYFEVVHNSNMPFVVKVGDQVITDLGTEFNINAYPDEGAITTSVLQGSIKIYVGSKTNLLIPGQQEIASVEGESVTIKNNADINKVMAWRKGLFEFNDTQLPVIMRQISRWYDIEVKFEGRLSKETFVGIISRNLPLSDVLKLLEANDVHFRIDNKTLYVSQ